MLNCVYVGGGCARALMCGREQVNTEAKGDSFPWSWISGFTVDCEQPNMNVWIWTQLLNKSSTYCQPMNHVFCSLFLSLYNNLRINLENRLLIASTFFPLPLHAWNTSAPLNFGFSYQLISNWWIISKQCNSQNWL